jgi:hypothetical protein
MRGAGGPYLPAGAMVVAVGMPVVFVLRLLHNAIKTMKLVVCQQCLFLLLYIVKHKHIAIQVMLIVAWPEPKPLLVQWNLGILGIAGKLLSWQEQLTHCIEASM